MTNLDFPRLAKVNYKLDAIEYVSTFFKGKGEDQAYLQALKDECKKYGVKSLLIMVDGEGPLADSSVAVRNKTVENHHKWVKAAKFLGCHSIRVNLQGQGVLEKASKAAIDGLSKLCDYAAADKINVIVENHGGNSSNAKWLTDVIKAVNKPNCGVLPDFGNFYEYDRYQGTQEMMPFAKGVSGKSYDFDAQGNETKIDYARMIKIVKDSGYKGYIDIEYEGSRLSEDEGIKATKALLERLIAQK
jgi:sugar phosphate isomerase/epimerase